MINEFIIHSKGTDFVVGINEKLYKNDYKDSIFDAMFTGKYDIDNNKIFENRSVVTCTYKKQRLVGVVMFNLLTLSYQIGGKLLDDVNIKNLRVIKTLKPGEKS